MAYLLWVLGSAVVLLTCWRILWALRWLRSHDKEMAEIHRQVCSDKPPRGPRMTKSAYEDLGELDDEDNA